MADKTEDDKTEKMTIGEEEAMREAALEEFRTIPRVGPLIAEDLWLLGIDTIEDLEGKDPEDLYDRMCEQEGRMVDRSMLYILKSAIYFVSNEEHDPELLKWWNWRDEYQRETEVRSSKSRIVRKA